MASRKALNFFAAYLFVLVVSKADRTDALDTTTFFISPKGDDNQGKGTEASPWASVERAQAALRQLRNSTGHLPGPVNVLLQPGLYRIKEAIVITSMDSGEEGKPVTFKAANSAQDTIISGGVPITGWQQSSAGVWKAQLSPTTKLFYQLFINGERREMARTETMEYQQVGDTLPEDMSFTLNKNTPVTDATTGQYIIYQTGQVQSTYHNLQDVQVVIYHSWTASIHRVKAIYSNNRTIYLQNPTTTRFNGGSGRRYYLQNAMELLAPGTFYYDSVSHTLYYHQAEGETGAPQNAVIPQVTELLLFEGDFMRNIIQYISWSGITFSHAAADYSACFSGTCEDQSANFLTTAALRIGGSRNCSFDRITVSHVGGYGIWLQQGCFNNTIHAAHVFDLGAGGVRIGQGMHGTVSDILQVNGNVLEDSILEDGGHIFQMGCGVLMQTAAMNSIIHNHIHHFRYTGVSGGWSWGYAATSTHDNLIGHNYIHNIGMGYLSDMGCVYTLGVQPGSQVVNNLCHDVWSFGYGGWGYYTDEGSSNMTYAYNIVYHTKSAGVLQHYGENNMFLNNIIAFPHYEPCPDALGQCHPAGVMSGQHTPGSGPGAYSSFTFMKNIVYIANGTLFFSGLPSGFDNMTFDDNVYWSTKDHADLTFPPSNHPVSFQQWKSKGKDVHSVLADPLFKNAEKFDFTELDPNSPALKLGFKPIDTSTIGPRQGIGKLNYI